MLDIREIKMFPDDVFVLDHVTALQGHKINWGHDIDKIESILQQKLDEAIASNQYKHYAFNTSLDGWVKLFDNFVQTNPNLLCFTGCLDVDNPRWIWWPHWQIVTDTDTPPITNPSLPDLRWQFWVRRPRQHRIELVKNIAHRQTPFGDIIFPTHLIEPTGRTYPTTRELFQDDDLYNSIHSQFNPAVDIPQGENGAYHGSYQLRSQRAIDVVTETMTNSQNGIYFSEKTHKAIRSGQLFLILGQQHCIRSLRDYGYKTFDNVIDHSYDLESDMPTRAKMIADELDRLSSLSLSDFRDLWTSTYNDRLYNQQYKKYNLDYWKKYLHSFF